VFSRLPEHLPVGGLAASIRKHAEPIGEDFTSLGDNTICMLLTSKRGCSDVSETYNASGCVYEKIELELSVDRVATRCSAVAHKSLRIKRAILQTTVIIMSWLRLIEARRGGTYV